MSPLSMFVEKKRCQERVRNQMRAFILSAEKS